MLNNPACSRLWGALSLLCKCCCSVTCLSEVRSLSEIGVKYNYRVWSLESRVTRVYSSKQQTVYSVQCSEQYILYNIYSIQYRSRSQSLISACVRHGPSFCSQIAVEDWLDWMKGQGGQVAPVAALQIMLNGSSLSELDESAAASQLVSMSGATWSKAAVSRCHCHVMSHNWCATKRRMWLNKSIIISQFKSIICQVNNDESVSESHVIPHPFANCCWRPKHKEYGP